MKAILIMDIDEKYIGSIGTEIQFINQIYNCKWKLKPMPEKKEPFGYLDMGNEDGLYEKGWNDCLEEIENESNT